MEFDKSKVYTALNADELKPGSTVIVADDLATLRQKVEVNNCPDTLEKVQDECNAYRFHVNEIDFMLCYLVSEPENLLWTKLKIGDIIQNVSRRAILMVTGIDSFNTDEHIFAGGWLADDELKHWEKVDG